MIFLTVVTGIARIGDMRKLGRVGLKALPLLRSGDHARAAGGVRSGQASSTRSRNQRKRPRLLDARAVQQYTKSGKQLHAVDFVLHIIPDTLAGAFANGEILQVLLIAILFG